jgi:HPt (histidine-containing phosphotransfer) domain-containing protein
MMPGLAQSQPHPSDAYINDQVIGRIRNRFLDSVPQRIAVLEDVLARVDLLDGEGAPLKIALEVVHKISGVALTLGFPQLGRHAQETETLILTLWRDPSNTQMAELVNAGLVDVLRNLEVLDPTI